MLRGPTSFPTGPWMLCLIPSAGLPSVTICKPPTPQNKKPTFYASGQNILHPNSPKHKTNILPLALKYFASTVQPSKNVRLSGDWAKRCNLICILRIGTLLTPAFITSRRPPLPGVGNSGGRAAWGGMGGHWPIRKGSARRRGGHPPGAGGAAQRNGRRVRGRPQGRGVPVLV